MKKILDIIHNINQFNPEPISNAKIKVILASFNLLNMTMDSLQIGKKDLYQISFNCIKKSCETLVERAKTFGEEENIIKFYEQIKSVDSNNNPNQELINAIAQISYFNQDLTFIENEFINQLNFCLIRTNLTNDELSKIPKNVFEKIKFIALQIFANVTVKHQEIFNAALVTSIGNLSNELEKIKSKINTDTLSNDINKLRTYNKSALDLISTNLEQNETQIELERLNIIDDIEKAIEKNNIISITGEPGVGKSALLKKIALTKEKFIVLSDKKLFELSQGWSNFFQTNLEDLLLYLNQEGYKYIFIDGLDKIIHPDQQTVIQDLINIINRTRENSHWKIIFTTRAYGNDSVNQPILDWLSLNNVFSVTVNEISNSEFTELTQKFPKLSSIFYQKEIFKITKNLFLLKILLSSDFYESLKDNEKISEIDISQIWWQKSINNGTLGTHRQNLLKIIANKSINGAFYTSDETCPDPI